MRHISLIIAVLALAIAAPAIAGKGGNGNGGGGGGGGNSRTHDGGGSGGGGGYTGWLEANPSTVQAGDYFDVHGCGYDTALGFVIVSFTGGSWPSTLDGDGCFTVTDIPALSGDTLAPGVYLVRALQYVHNNWTETGETSFTVVS
jgi:hypothetical protein